MALGRKPGRPPKARPNDVIDLVSDEETLVDALPAPSRGKKRVVRSESAEQEQEENVVTGYRLAIGSGVRATHSAGSGDREASAASTVLPRSRAPLRTSSFLNRRIESVASASTSTSTLTPAPSSFRLLPAQRQRLHAVEVPFLPRQTLRRYYHPPGTTPPSSARPATATSVSEADEDRMPYLTRARSRSASGSALGMSMRAPREGQNKGKQPVRYAPDRDADEEDELDQDASSSDPIGRDEDEEEESTEQDEEGSEGSDGVALRRSARSGKGAYEASKQAIKNRLRSQAALGSGLTSRSSANPLSISESSFYGSRTSSAAPTAKSRLSGWKTRADASERSSSAYDDEEEDEDEGEDELDELESESEGEQEWRETSKRSKAKTKGGRRGKRARLDSSDEEEEEDETEILGRHRPFCEKCRQGPADVLLEKARKKKKKGGGKRRKHEDDMSDTEIAEALEGWLECDHCVTSWHWGCLGAHQQKDAVQLLRAMDGPPGPNERLRHSVRIDESVTFQCRKCQETPACMVCHKADIVPPEPEPKETAAEPEGGKGSDDAEGSVIEDAQVKEETTLDEATQPDESGIKFRCLRCAQSAHYQHLPNPTSGEHKPSLADTAVHYQQGAEGKRNAWLCHQCRHWIWKVDMVIGWRPLPADAREEHRPGVVPAWTSDLPREYLIKFADRGFRHATWVPHAWLRALAPQRLRNFLEKGPSLDLITDESLAARGDVMEKPTVANVLQEEETAQQSRPKHHGIPAEKEEAKWRGGGPPPDRDAKLNLPIAWSTIDRVLDVYLVPPRSRKEYVYTKRHGRIESDLEREGPVYEGPDGLMPELDDVMVPIDEWERQAGRQIGEDDADELAGMVSWLLAKWDDLQYDQSTWDTPPPRDSDLYPAYKRALKRYLGARNVRIPVLSPPQCARRDAIRTKDVNPPQNQPDCVVGGKLMDFQMEGLQWLLTKYYKRASAILADDMGLGKTVQIASMLGYLGATDIYPCLVVVPNSTITNWVREFEKWVPHIRVVPYYGEAASRKVIREYELYHKGKQGKAEGLKAHVVLTTYDMITGKEFKVFKSIPRWDVLCVDEGQRLKSDASNIFANLKQLNSVHRLLLTGTPLNNNIRELFNLLNFLDPDNFTDREALEKEYDQDKLNDELVRQLHSMVQPYILRRIKADVLRLPPKVEIIVPISLSNMQADVYKLILQSNAMTLQRAVERREKEQKRIAARQVKEKAGADTVVEKQNEREPGNGGPVPEGGEAERATVGPAAAPPMEAEPTALTQEALGVDNKTAEEEVEASI